MNSNYKNTFFFLLLAVFGFFISTKGFSQSDSLMLRKIYTEALVNGQSYENLRYLCKEIGPRLSGSDNAEKAIQWSKKLMESYGFDSVWLQPVQVPRWVRGGTEEAKIISKNGATKVNVTSLGNTFGTGKKGITAEIIEVKSLDDLEKKGDAVKGKIVFISQPFPQDLINTFEGYSTAGVIRFSGPAKAAKLGAVGVVVRSLDTSTDDAPHTGTTDSGDDSTPKIPSVAISTQDADLLSKKIAEEKGLKFYLKNECRMEGEAPSYNVVGEIKGSKFPDEIIVMGGHLDSWDLAEGAHDDGTGMMHTIEALRILKNSYTPKRTIRVVMFINEENGLAGGTQYAELAKENKEKHIAALESDSGGFLPLGFSMDASDETIQKIATWKALFEPYNIYIFKSGHGGSDIGPLKDQDVPLIGLRVESQRYFDYHHSAKDVFENVNKRELELGCATLSSLVYLIDNHGL